MRKNIGLYRGKRKDTGEWIYGNLVEHDEKYYIYYEKPDEMCQTGNWLCSKEVIHETVGQHTRLTDKNGNKIFEDDIVKATIHRCYGCNPQKREEIKIIAYDNLGILGLKNNEGVWSDFMEELSLSGSIEDYYFEVIGNIHDNPELLKGGER